MERPDAALRPPFNSLYRHGFVRAAVCIPTVRIAAPGPNAEAVIDLARQASAQGAAVALFPELSLSAYTVEDLVQQDALLEAVLHGLELVRAASTELLPVLIVGAPLRFGNALYNCAVALYRGRVLGVTPKSYLPNYREFYEKRQYTSGFSAVFDRVNILGQDVPFGANLVLRAANLPAFALHMEICEDVWTPVPPSTFAALAGATVLVNLSASNITIGKDQYRKDLCAAQSGKCIAAYLYSAAGPGESTTDLAWDGHALIYENNELLAESERFAETGHMVLADIDLERLLQDRMRQTSFADSAARFRFEVQAVRVVDFDFEVPLGELPLVRHVERFPFVPDEPTLRDERCYEAYNIQVHGLKTRLRSIGAGTRVVIGVSGGLDSTHALIVAAKTMDQLGLSREHILAYTLPGFATSDATLANAHALMKALGVTAHEMDIKPSCLQMLKDLGHPFVDGHPVYDITFENVQAGERTSHLFRLANFHNGIVLGTGDLSELALGWCTYGVGDHMSHYNVNASVPKTLIQHLIRWVVDSCQFDEATGRILTAILNTEITPELVPAGAGDEPIQSTQAKVGPYELQDFNLYYVTRYGFRPSKVAFLSHTAWADRNRGSWPFTADVMPQNEYDLATIKKWLEVFLARFFGFSQFKRSCVPNSPKVGSGGSLSPRGDWRAPSDGESLVWLEELRAHVPER